MQPIPGRLSQTIWSAFRSAKPVRTIVFPHQIQDSTCRLRASEIRPFLPTSQPRYIRSYSSRGSRPEDSGDKVEDAKQRDHDALSSQAAAMGNAEPGVNHSREAKATKSEPESFSKVYEKSAAHHSSEPEIKSTHSSTAHTSPLPSQIADLRSRLTKRLSQHLDKLQTNIFFASQRLNDLTGYTGIERLKRDIDTQESVVQAARRLVKSNRDNYAEAISMRSNTQREVNDLLHRKHSWSPQDLERFTNLYRSDHANEQIEQKAHQELSDAEVKYEEASTKLAKCILARYHEEQIWSDKIRQMSTWGTWGLMGLNLLLFVVLQLAIEPWRRRRLVRGFEEKVEVALAAREQEYQDLRTQLRNQAGNEVVTDAVAKEPESTVAAAGEQLAEVIVDAVAGSTEGDAALKVEAVDTAAIEAAAEEVTSKEIDEETRQAAGLSQQTGPITGIETSDHTLETSLPSESQPPTPLSQLPSLIYATVSQAFISRYYSLLHQFDTTDHVMLSRRELTTKVLEGVATGIALVGGIMFVVVRTR